MSNLPGLVERADLWIHGHTHDGFDYQVERCRVVCNPRGYANSADLRGLMRGWWWRSEVLLFLDCEFTDFCDIDLISIGLVSDDGRHEFYAERTDFRREACSEFVRAAVLPLLGQDPAASCTREELKTRLWTFFAGLPGEDVDSAVVRIDVPDQPRVIVKNVDVFFRVAKAGFGQKRKQLHNSLAAGLPVEHAQIVQALNKVEIDPKRRAETLTLDEWGRLSERLIGDWGSGIRDQDVLPAE